VAQVLRDIGMGDVFPGYEQRRKEAVGDVLQDALLGLVSTPASLIRYRGRKIQEGKALGKAIEPVKGTLRELFGGTLALSRGIFGAGKAKRVIIGEKSPYMLNLYKQIKDRPEQVADLAELYMRRLDSLPKDKAVRYAKEVMSKLKKGQLSEVEEAAADIFVGQRSMAYSPREIPAFLPSTKYASPESVRAKIYATSELLQKAKIKTDWAEVVRGARKGDVVLADPPYHGTRGYESTGKFQTEPLSDALQRLSKRGVEGIVWTGEAGVKKFPWAEFKKVKPTEFAAGIGGKRLVDLLPVRTVKRKTWRPK